jgi:O-acetyl-ADP-ribose deacetylase (regulator of RNase III)
MFGKSIKIGDACRENHVEAEYGDESSIKDLIYAISQKLDVPASDQIIRFGQLFSVAPPQIYLYDPRLGVFTTQEIMNKIRNINRHSVTYHLLKTRGFGFKNVLLSDQQSLGDVSIAVVVEINDSFYPIIFPKNATSHLTVSIMDIVAEQYLAFRSDPGVQRWFTQEWGFRNQRTLEWITGFECDFRKVGLHGDHLKLEQKLIDEISEDDVFILDQEENQPVQNHILEDIAITPLPPPKYSNVKIEIVQGDITSQVVTAIVNAANPQLAGGGGVDGAIHRAAGPELVRASRLLAPCRPGEAVLTPGFRLISDWVIHTVGPIYKDGQHHEEEILSQAYCACLAIAFRSGFQSVAFPAISTGVYGFPAIKAARIALETVFHELDTHAHPILETIRFVLYDQDTYNIYIDQLEDIWPNPHE